MATTSHHSTMRCAANLSLAHRGRCPSAQCRLSVGRPLGGPLPGASRRLVTPCAAAAKEVWVQTQDKATFLAAAEAGVATFVIRPEDSESVQEWCGGLSRGAGSVACLTHSTGGALKDGGGRQVGEVAAVADAAAATALEGYVQKMLAVGGPPGGVVGAPYSVVLDAQDWKVIPTENLVARLQPQRGSSGGGSSSSWLRLFAAASSAADSRLMLEALEAGTAGVLLRTDQPDEVKQLLKYVAQRATEEASVPGLSYEAARVVRVSSLGMGDRACVDLACLLAPGEGLLVGSFARCLALIHSECEETNYIASRPFRVNAGPVHAYVACPGGRTRYLSELGTGSEVVVADAAGRTRTALVGRVKVEKRPLVVVELETEDGARHSLMLQNAETVKLVGPSARQADSPSNGNMTNALSGLSGSAAAAAAAAAAAIRNRRGVAEGAPAPAAVQAAPAQEAGAARRGWEARSVGGALQPGTEVYVLRLAAARHTGLAVQEFVLEK